jgi:Arc/MetJ-type ribon-helix-helix transcriptional regulator
MSQTAIWTISLPKTLEKEALKVGRQEYRTKSELIREALRKYIQRFYMLDEDAMLKHLTLEMEKVLDRIDTDSLPSLEEQLAKV